MTIDEQIAEIDKTIAMLVKARRTLLAMANVKRELKEKQSMEDCISRKQLYDSMTEYLILKPPIELKE